MCREKGRRLHSRKTTPRAGSSDKTDSEVIEKRYRPTRNNIHLRISSELQISDIQHTSYCIALSLNQPVWGIFFFIS